MDSNDLAIGSTAERMEPVPAGAPAVAPAQGEVAAQNQQNPSKRHPRPPEPVPERLEKEPGSDADKGSDPDDTGDSENEGSPHRVDSLA